MAQPARSGFLVGGWTNSNFEERTVKNVSLLKICLMSLLLIPAFSNAADRVGDFSLLDQEGNYHGMSWYDDHAAVALLVQANGSAASRATN